MEETNPKETNSGDLELESSEGTKDVSKTEDLEAQSSEEAKYYQELTGREDIKSKEDFEKHYSGLKSLVGDQKVAEMREKAESFDKMIAEANKIVDEAEKTGEISPIEEEKIGRAHV